MRGGGGARRAGAYPGDLARDRPHLERRRSGAAPGGNWADPANWSAGVAPTNGETIGTLTFPALGGPACSSISPATACGRGVNDLTDLTIGTLAINDAHVARPGAAYAMRGNGITLTGGLTASPGAVTSSGDFESSIALPITLGAAQTWSVSGTLPASAVGRFVPGDGISLLAPITGSAQPLTIRLSGGISLSAFPATTRWDPSQSSGLTPVRRSRTGSRSEGPT